MLEKVFFKHNSEITIDSCLYFQPLLQITKCWGSQAKEKNKIKLWLRNRTD